MNPGRLDARRGGFSLMELLTAMIVISILAAIAIPNFKDATARADSRKILSDIAAIRVAVLEYREDHSDLPRRARWGTVPPDLAPYLNNVEFTYKDVRYRMITRRRRGRVDVIVRYPRGSPVGAALLTFARPGTDSGSINWNRRRTRFRLLENNQ